MDFFVPSRSTGIYFDYCSTVRFGLQMAYVRRNFEQMTISIKNGRRFKMAMKLSERIYE